MCRPHADRIPLPGLCAHATKSIQYSQMVRLLFWVYPGSDFLLHRKPDRTEVGILCDYPCPADRRDHREVTRMVTRRRRAKYLFLLISAGALLGGLPPLLSLLLRMLMPLSQGGSGFRLLFSTLWHGAYVIMVTSTVYYRVSGLVFNR